MRYLSVCSGIEAASVAFEPLGWTPVAFSEIDPFPSAVLKERYPDVPNLGDMTKYKEWDIGPVDVLVGGTPCQSFSIAGLRKGMDDPRGNLALVYCGILDQFKPRWFVWENVPGVLSSGRGRDFGSFLGAVVKLGYGFSYRVLDAQFFGVPQRRRRVFVVGYLGDWRRAAAVLSERESMCRNTSKGRGKKQEVARTLRGRAHSSHREDSETYIAKCLTRSGQRLDAETETFVTHALRGEGFDASEGGTGRGTPLVSCTLPASDGGVSSGMHPVIAIQERAVAESITTGPQGTGVRSDGMAFTLEARHRVQAVAFSCKDYAQDAVNDMSPTLRAMGGNVPNGGGQVAVAYQCHGSSVGPMGTLRAGNGNETGGVPFMAFAENSRSEVRLEGGDGQRVGCLSAGGGKPGQGSPMVSNGMAVRRLTPRECERLQGFPDDSTLIQYRGKPACDGPRYKSIGNSMAVPVMRWLGERIAFVDSIQ